MVTTHIREDYMNPTRYSIAIIKGITDISIKNTERAIGALSFAALMLLMPEENQADMFDAFSLKVTDLIKDEKDIDTLAGLAESLGITMSPLIYTMDQGPAAFFKDQIGVLCDRYAMLTSTADLSRIERAVFTRLALRERLAALDAAFIRPGQHRVGNSGGGRDGPNGSTRANNVTRDFATA
jgi:hypothetical protein